MEQKYLDELSKLGFSDAEAVKTVLASRAYHNRYTDITDSSYAVLNMPACLDAATEGKLQSVIFDALSGYYQNSVRLTHFAPGGGSPIMVRGNSIQFTFSGALSEEELVRKVTDLLQNTLQTVQELHLEATSKDPEDPDVKKQKRALTIIGKRVKAILLFIKAGSTAYEYHTEYYHPLD